MSQKAIITDLNKCVGCLACVVGCKTANEVPIGKFRNSVYRIGPTPKFEGAQMPDMEMYFLPVSCQHCANPECVTVCPTGASVKEEDGTVRINAGECIGCLLCMDACPYGVRFFNEDTSVVEKCDLCADLIDNGELPQCVAQCCARARFVGDLDEGLESFEGPGRVLSYGATYEDVHNARVKMIDAVREFDAEGDVYRLADGGNAPQFAYILRGKTWREDYEKGVLL